MDRAGRSGAAEGRIVRASFAAETMLRIYFMQQWFALSDPGMEEALHDIATLRAFARLDAGTDLIPDESSILRFRHRLEQRGLAERLLAEVNAPPVERGRLRLRSRELNSCALMWLKDLRRPPAVPRPRRRSAQPVRPLP